MPDIRPARAEDAPMLARIHVQSWDETYTGLLPRSEFDARGYEVRLAQWQSQISQGQSRIAVCPGLGFAQMGPQRDAGLAARGWGEELYCLYLLQQGQGRGTGRALMEAVVQSQPFTALVLANNTPACGFYEAMGGQRLEARRDRIGQTEIREVVYGFRPGAP